jgi:hypothetical protein
MHSHLLFYLLEMISRVFSGDGHTPTTFEEVTLGQRRVRAQAITRGSTMRMSYHGAHIDVKSTFRWAIHASSKTMWIASVNQ